MAGAASQIVRGGMLLGKRGVADADARARACARTDDGAMAQARLREAAVAAGGVGHDCSMAAALDAPAADAAEDSDDGGELCATVVATTSTACAPAQHVCGDLDGVAVVRTGGVGVDRDNQPLQSLQGGSLGACGSAMASDEQWPVACAVRADAVVATAVDGDARRSMTAAAVAIRGQTSSAAFDAPADMAQRAHKRALTDDAEATGACTLDASNARRRRRGDVERDAVEAAAMPRMPPTPIEAASLPITSMIADADDQSRGVVRRRAPDAWGRERLLRRRVDGSPEHAATDAPT